MFQNWSCKGNQILPTTILQNKWLFLCLTLLQENKELAVKYLRGPIIDAIFITDAKPTQRLWDAKRTQLHFSFIKKIYFKFI